MKTSDVMKSSFINMSLQIFPILSALLSVPLTIKWFGSELFAVFSLSISIVVLFNYLNFGVAQSVNRLLAHESCEKSISDIISSSFLIMLLIGVTVSVATYFFSYEIVSLFIDSSNDNYQNAYKMLSAVLYASPLFLLIILLRAILEAKLLFKITAVNRAFLNSVLFLSPAICYIAGLEMFYAMYIAITIHIVSFIFLLNRVFHYYTHITKSFDSYVSKQLITSGGWLTLISLSSIILIYADKFIISSNIGLLELAYYVAAYDLISRTSIVYGSISAAFFPAFSFWFKNGHIAQLKESINTLYILIALMMGVIVVGTLLLSKSILAIWINADYAKNSAQLLNILSIGVFFQALAVVPLRVLTATVFEKPVALIYLILSALYLLLSIYLSHIYSVIAIAILFSVKAVFEFVVLHCYMSFKITIDSFDFSFLYRTMLVIVFVFLFSYYDFYIQIISSSILIVVLFFPREKDKARYVKMLSLVRNKGRVEKS